MAQQPFQRTLLMTCCILLVFGLVLSAAVTITRVQAQDATPVAETTVCDSTLVLLVYLAGRDYGYVPVADLTTFNLGQYGVLFEQLMMMPGMDVGTENLDATEEAAIESTPSDAGMTALQPGNIEGENAACAELRADVETYLFEQLNMELSMESESGAAFSANLSGDQEMPDPGDEDGSGTATVTINSDTNEVCYELSVENITLPADAAHIHVGEQGTSGDVVVPFPTAPDTNGVASGCTQADPAVIAALLENPDGYYVNVHNSDFPSGAVRGQLSSN